jgi:hypothetical protein
MAMKCLPQVVRHRDNRPHDVAAGTLELRRGKTSGIKAARVTRYGHDV